MRKFYKKAEAGTAPGGHVIRLDGKPVKTMLQHSLILESKELAEAIAAEWQAQDKDIIPATMPLTQLASTMADKAKGPDRGAMNVEILKYAASDLICYFAPSPPELVRRQELHWLPLLSWLDKEHGVKLERVDGIKYHNQPAASLETLNKIVTGLSPAAFTVMQATTAVAGSAVIGLALQAGYLDADSAYDAALVDELYQLETWGEDELATDRLKNIKAELTAITLFRDLVGA